MPSFLLMCTQCGHHTQGIPHEIQSAHICKKGAERHASFEECLIAVARAMTQLNVPPPMLTESNVQPAAFAPPLPPPPPPVNEELIAELEDVLR